MGGHNCPVDPDDCSTWPGVWKDAVLCAIHILGYTLSIFVDLSKRFRFSQGRSGREGTTCHVLSE